MSSKYLCFKRYQSYWNISRLLNACSKCPWKYSARGEKDETSPVLTQRLKVATGGHKANIHYLFNPLGFRKWVAFFMCANLIKGRDRDFTRDTKDFRKIG